MHKNLRIGCKFTKNVKLTVVAAGNAVVMGSYDGVFEQSQQNLVFTYADPSLNWVLFAPVTATKTVIGSDAIRFFMLNVAIGVGKVDLLIDDIVISSDGIEPFSAVVRDLYTTRGATFKFRNHGTIDAPLASTRFDVVPATGSAVVVALVGKNNDANYPLAIVYTSSAHATLSFPTLSAILALAVATLTLVFAQWTQ